MIDLKSNKNKLTDWLKGKNRKKIFENLVIIIIVGIIIIIVGESFFNKDDKPEDVKEPVLGTYTDARDPDIRSLEKDLELILSEIEGAGNVRVMITLDETRETIHAYNTHENNSLIDEEDSSGGTRKSNEYGTQKEMVFQNSNGENEPVIIKQIEPSIRGVVVVADGAGSAAVRQNISNAVLALMDVPAHKIQVLKRQMQHK